MTAHQAEKALLVHPDDVNLADVKALAAEHGVSAEGNRFVPHGHAFLVDETAARYVPFPPEGLSQ